MTTTYDYIIIGAGTGGCALAHRLVKAGARVLLVEAGGRDTEPKIHSVLLPDLFPLWFDPSINWGYTTEPQAGLEDRVIPVARGKVWGGSSSINAMLHVRGSRHDYDGWVASGAAGWGYDEVLPYFKRMENFEGAAGSPWRGVGGPLNVITHDKPTAVSHQLYPASLELGFVDRGRDFDYNGEHQDEAVFYYQANKTPGERQRASEAVAYLYPILDDPNFTVMSHTQASRLLFEGDRCIGVEVAREGALESLHAADEVIVCAGAYESPKLLMLSGIGDEAALAAHGIDVRLHLPGVGQNLQDHMITAVVTLCQHPDEFIPVLLSETGFFTHINTPSDGVPDLQIKFGGLKFANPAYDREGAGYSFAPVLAMPESVGYVTLRSTDPMATAIVQPNYLSADADMRVFLRGIELARAFNETSAFGDWYQEEIQPGLSKASEAELRAFVRENATTLWHPVGTCKMGVDNMAVVDPALRVRGLRGLRIADASVMPRITAGNTNAPVVMIAEKAADLILADRALV